MTARSPKWDQAPEKGPRGLPHPLRSSTGSLTAEAPPWLSGLNSLSQLAPFPTVFHIAHRPTEGLRGLLPFPTLISNQLTSTVAISAIRGSESGDRAKDLASSLYKQLNWKSPAWVLWFSSFSSALCCQTASSYFHFCYWGVRKQKYLMIRHLAPQSTHLSSLFQTWDGLSLLRIFP